MMTGFPHVFPFDYAKLAGCRARLGRWQPTRPVKELDERLACYGWSRKSTT